MVNELLNVAAVTATFIACLGILYLIQKVTLGFIPGFKRIVYKSISYGDLIFVGTSIIFIINYVDFYRPY